MARQQHPSINPNSPLAADVVPLDGGLEADIVAELETGSFEQLTGEGDVPIGDPPAVEAPPAAEPEPVPDPEPEPPAAAAEPEPEPAPEPEPKIDQRALAAVEQREAAVRALEAELKEKQAAFDNELARVRESLQKEYPEELLKRAREAERMANWTDRQKAEYYFKRYKAAEGEPGYEEAAERMHQDSVAESRTAALEAEIRQLKADREADKKAAADAQSAAQRRAAGEKYLADAAAQVDPQTMPNLAADLKADPIAAQTAIGREIARLHRQYGELPPVNDVLVSMEKSRREWLAARGYQPVTAAPLEAPKAQTTAAKAPATISSDLSTSTSTEAEPTSIEERVADVTREIERSWATT